MALGAGVSDVEHSTPAILWAGRDGRGENVVVSSSGFPGQGRVLRVRGSGKDSEVLWTHYATVPATPVHGVSEPVTWRVPVGPRAAPDRSRRRLAAAGRRDRHRVDVAGEQRAVQTADGLGTVEAGPRDNVRLRGRLADGSTFDSTIRPGDADPWTTWKGSTSSRPARRETSADLLSSTWPPGRARVHPAGPASHVEVPDTSARRPERVLAVAAHPDDLDFGASGTVASWVAAGAEATYLVITRGDQGGFDDTPREHMPAIREKEQRDAAAAVACPTSGSSTGSGTAGSSRRRTWCGTSSA